MKKHQRYHGRRETAPETSNRADLRSTSRVSINDTSRLSERFRNVLHLRHNVRIRELVRALDRNRCSPTTPWSSRDAPSVAASLHSAKEQKGIRLASSMRMA
jgi:hypothetical protein